MRKASRASSLPTQAKASRADAAPAKNRDIRPQLLLQKRKAWRLCGSAIARDAACAEDTCARPQDDLPEWLGARHEPVQAVASELASHKINSIAAGLLQYCGQSSTQVPGTASLWESTVLIRRPWTLLLWERACARWPSSHAHPLDRITAGKQRITTLHAQIPSTAIPCSASQSLRRR